MSERFTGQMDWPCLCGHPKSDHYFGDRLGADGRMHTWCQRAVMDGCACPDFQPTPPTPDPRSAGLTADANALATQLDEWLRLAILLRHDLSQSPDPMGRLSPLLDLIGPQAIATQKLLAALAAEATDD